LEPRDGVSDGADGKADDCQQLRSLQRESRREKVTRQMEKYRRGESHGIQAIQHSPMAFYQSAPILDTAVALDSRHNQASKESHYGNSESHPRRLQRAKWRDPPESGSEERRTYHTTGETLDRF